MVIFYGHFYGHLHFLWTCLMFMTFGFHPNVFFFEPKNPKGVRLLRSELPRSGSYRQIGLDGNC